MDFSEVLSIFYHAAAYIAVGFIIFLIGKYAYQLLNQSFSVKEELVEKDNLAFAFANVGYYIGLLIIIGGAIIGPSKGLVQDLIDIGIFGVLGIVLLNLSILFNDKIILRNFSIKKEIIEDRNIGTGIIEAAVAVASGLIIFGAITGEYIDPETEEPMYVGLGFSILTAVVFWAVGQVAMFIISKVYQIITPYDVHEHIEKDNVAVGIGFAGVLVAVANLIRFGLEGNFEGWGETLGYAGFELLVGIILLPVMRLITDKILLPGQKLTDEIINQEKPNIGAAMIEAFSYIGGSVLITWCL
jgi:uncharacterized membrane protein YjfL (UPF0719 family)